MRPPFRSLLIVAGILLLAVSAFAAVGPGIPNSLQTAAPSTSTDKPAVSQPNASIPSMALASSPAAAASTRDENVLTSWQPVAGYDSPRMQLTNMGEARLNIFRGHDLTSLGDRAVGSILYAPSEPDNPTFRAAVATCSGATVDYFDASAGTPSVALLATYDCVLTWADYAYADNITFGNNLASYVDGGGKVILGQWCYYSGQLNSLAGTIMTSAYCPVTTSTSYDFGAYDNDGTDCVHGGVSYYDTSYLDVATVIGGAYSDGTFNNGSNSLAVAWRADRRVYYSPGNTGGTYGTGQWAELLCNICECADYGDILYAPSEPDNPTFRADVAACSGLVVDYFDASAGTPSVALLANYSCVFTWADYAYADSTTFGNNLATYVDGGGKVILGQWCYPSNQGNYLAGTIMTSAYCPVTTSTSYDFGAYDNDGTDCVHSGVSYYDTSYLDVASLVGGAYSDGTFNNGSNSLAVAWRADRRVYYSPGNTGATYGTGQWAELLCNLCSCAPPSNTVSANLTTVPGSGSLPFASTFTAQMGNLITDSRRAAGRINVVTGNGSVFNNWRSGWTNLSPSATFTTSWGQVFPASPVVLGNNVFTLQVEDVTPSPYNQPPYAPSGDTDSDISTVTGY